ncbi:hypothetical protein MMC19_007692 [Ptychographa xylographoides]|nr:hypothetical protein [Ptychographa xylographoides]
MPITSKEDRHTPHTGLKPIDAYNAITDPNVLPTLDDAPTSRRLQSSIVLVTLLSGAIFGAWFLGVDILQTQTQIIGIGGAVLAAIAFAGGLQIDWWGLVMGYWWLSMPVAGLAGVGFLLMQEQATSLQETD